MILKAMQKEAKAGPLNSERGERFRLWLQTEYSKRADINPRYSLRAFANLLGLEPSYLSKIINKKRRVTVSVIARICDALAISEKERAQFLSVEAETDKNNFINDYQQIALDHFIITSDWYYYAILELSHVKNFKSCHKWIAKELDIDVLKAKIAVERLTRVGLFVEKEGCWTKPTKSISNEVSSIDSTAAHKKLQTQIIEKALLAVEACPQEHKDITSMTMAIDKSKIKKAKEKIKLFRRELCSFLEGGEQTEVYNLGIQLYPLTKIKK